MKKAKNIRKKPGCEFIRINTSNAENGYDLDYEVSDREAFIDEFNKKKIKKQEEKNKDKGKDLKKKLEK